MTAATAAPSAVVPAPAAHLGHEVSFALRRQRRSLGSWAGAVAVYSALLMALWPSIHGASTLNAYVNSLPEGLRRAFNLTDMTSAAGYLGGELFSLVLPLLMIAAAIATAVTLTAAYEEAGYFETLLALPVTRARMLPARALSALTGVLGIGVVLYAVVTVTAAGLGMGLAQRAVIGGASAVVALALVHGAVVCLCAGAGLRRTQSIGVAAAVAILGYLMNNLLPQIHALSGIDRFSPWHWTVGRDPLHTGIPVTGLLLSLGISVVLAVLGTVAFARRDIGQA